MAHEPNPVHEVQDHEPRWVFFERLFGEIYDPLANEMVPVGSLRLPKIDLGFYEFQLTKFMILEVIAAILIIALFVPLARKMREGELPQGWWWNLRESLLGFIRDQIAKPNLGQDADKFVPYLWTLF